jgi:hypothetical protein
LVAVEYQLMLTVVYSDQQGVRRRYTHDFAVQEIWLRGDRVLDSYFITSLARAIVVFSVRDIEHLYQEINFGKKMGKYGNIERKGANITYALVVTV